MGLKKANFFSFDAILASMLLLGGLLIINSIPPEESSVIAGDTLSKDILSALSNVKVNEIEDITVQGWIINGTIERGNNSILVQSGEFWASNDTGKAQYLIETFLNTSFTGEETLNIRLSMANEEIYSRAQVPIANSKNVITSRRMITGVQKGSAITGSTASAFLRKVKDKKTASFVYFGGFVGQGNITAFMRNIPVDVTAADITELIIEADAGKSFEVYINGIFCDLLSPSSGSGTPDVWDITVCKNSIQAGSNEFILDFNTLNDAFIAGGFIKLSYQTDEFRRNSSYGELYYYFPGIDGIVNLFDSFYVPGNLTATELYLHYDADNSASNNTFFFTVGNTTVYTDINSSTEQFISLGDATLSSILDYSSLSRNTAPVRVGFENLSYAVELTGVADVALITDVSGSMDWRMDVNNIDGVVRTCEDAQLGDVDSQRLSVAKCLDKQFANDIINITGNKMALVSYDWSTNNGETVSLTTNLTLLNNTINGYNADGATCICCGINSAKNELTTNVQRTLTIAAGSTWLYNNSYHRSTPPDDFAGYEWFEREYNDTIWNSGSAVLGHNAGGGGIAIVTEMDAGPLATTVYYQFPEPNDGDELTSIVEFTNSIVTSANTYGLGAGYDEWDWGGADYGFGITPQVDYNEVWDNALHMDFRTGGFQRNICPNRDCNGGYGISINITQQFLDTMNANGTAIIQFDYEWAARVTNPFENNDEIWIKSRWNSPTSGTHYLGEELSSIGGDTTLEVDNRNNPDVDFTGTYELDIGNWIEGTGIYYLELGAKLLANQGGEYGNVTFDNIELYATNDTDYYYLRKHFTIDAGSISNYKRGVVNLLNQESATVYVNGNLIHSSAEEQNGTYWDERGIFVDGNFFRAGDNVVAVELTNVGGDARFDLELAGINNTRTGALMAMTDGQANVECPIQGTGDASDDAIKAACDAAEDYGIISYAVGYSDAADESVLDGIATCGNGKYIKSSDINQLGTFYQDTAIEIAEITRQSQTIIVSQGTPTASVLYPDSYLRLNFDPDYEVPKPDEISITFQTPQFNGCNSSFSIPQGMRVIDAVATSYSGSHWTSYVGVDNNSVFNLSEYGSQYLFLGDPFIVQLPPSSLSVGTHDVGVYMSDAPGNFTMPCALNNSVIYTALITASTPRSSVVEKAEGCIWNIEFEDNTNITQPIPSDYSGSATCSYTNSSISYDITDAYDTATHDILNQLDFDDDGRVLININAADLEIIVTIVKSVPFLWGPALVQAEVWS